MAFCTKFLFIDVKTPNFVYLLTYFHRILRVSLGASSLDALMKGPSLWLVAAASACVSFYKISCEEISFWKISFEKNSFEKISWQKISFYEFSF